MKNDKTSTMNKIDIAKLQEWAVQIHGNAIRKGFYDKDSLHGFVQNQKLEIVKEIGEFHDAWKKDNEKYKEELADVVIRLLDYLQFQGVDIELYSFMSEITFVNEYTVSKEAYMMAGYVTNDWLMPVILRCFQLATYLNFDLYAEIEKKMNYNTTRPYLHGNKI